MTPQQLRYTSEHEWVTEPTEAGTIRIGITEYAQNALGDIVYVDLPEVGATFSAGDAIGEVESTKSVSDLYAPVSGTVAARNDDLADTPEVINTSPYDAGWLLEIEVNDVAEVAGLLDFEAYVKLTE